MLDLKQFCSTDETRDYIQQPFSRGEFTYATNGYILVRVPRRDDVPERDSAPHAERVMPSPPKRWRKLKATKLPKERVEECDACDGSGNEHDDCPNCNCKCVICDGAGTVSSDRYKAVRINGVPFDLRYARMLLTLPNIEVGDPTPPAAAMAFRFDGGEGALMPLNGECVDAVDAVDMDLAA